MTVERLDQLIEKGKSVLKTHVPNPPNIIGFTTLDEGSFTSWRSQVLNYLYSKLPSDNQYLIAFSGQVQRAYISSVKEGIGILQSIIEDINEGIINFESENKFEPINPLIKIFDRFHLIVRQLRNRYNNRETLNVNDEYDVQNLLHALLNLDFEDIRAEEWTPSYAGKSSRMDFLLKDFKIIIEVKKTRNGLAGKEIGSQLIDDIARYKSHPNCETLLCLVYDPEGYIGNPRGLENDLSKDDAGLKVKVYIRP